MIKLLTAALITEIQKILMSLKSNKSPGADNISPKILKEISTDIIGPLAYFWLYAFS